jgi:hypothetical protein
VCTGRDKRMKIKMELFSLLFLTALTVACCSEKMGPAGGWGEFSQGQNVAWGKGNADFGNIPLSFEANRGQADGRVRFLARGKGWTLLLTPEASMMVLPAPSRSGGKERGSFRKMGPESPRGRHVSLLSMSFVGASTRPEILGMEKLPGRSNYYFGSDPQKWVQNVPHFEKVKYSGLYPGIDVEFYGRRDRIEYDFVVAPGRNPSEIGIRFSGTSRATIREDGSLHLQTAEGEIIHHPPNVYQEIGGVRKAVSSRFVNKGRDAFGFEVAAYDHSKSLIIDPEISFATYLGGDSLDEVLSLAVDFNGNAIVTGRTQSSDFPLNIPEQSLLRGTTDIFVTKFNQAGTGIVYSTYLGGLGDDVAYGIAVDGTGNAYVTGSTDSATFPVPGGFQTNLQGVVDAFLAKFGPLGSLLNSTYLGGDEVDEAFAISVSPAGNAFLTGSTASTNFPTTLDAFQLGFGGGSTDAFVSKIEFGSFPNPTSLSYSSYLGGSGDDAGIGIALDSSPIPNVFVAGNTRSDDFPTKSPQSIFQPDLSGTEDAFVAKINTGFVGLLTLIYSTYLGGGGADSAAAVDVDASGNAYVTGDTGSSDFPVEDPFQSASEGGFDAFVTKMDTAGSALIYSTYLGGSGSEEGTAIEVTSSGIVYVTGTTGSSDFPVEDPIQADIAGSNDLFVTKFETSGSSIEYSTYIGGSGFDSGEGITFKGSNEVYVAGFTDSNDFPADAFDEEFNGNRDGFVVKIDERNRIQGFDVVSGCSIINVKLPGGEVIGIFGPLVLALIWIGFRWKNQ